MVFIICVRNILMYSSCLIQNCRIMLACQPERQQTVLYVNFKVIVTHQKWKCLVFTHLLITRRNYYVLYMVTNHHYCFLDILLIFTILVSCLQNVLAKLSCPVAINLWMNFNVCHIVVFAKAVSHSTSELFVWMILHTLIDASLVVPHSFYHSLQTVTSSYFREKMH